MVAAAPLSRPRVHAPWRVVATMRSVYGPLERLLECDAGDRGRREWRRRSSIANHGDTEAESPDAPQHRGDRVFLRRRIDPDAPSVWMWALPIRSPLIAESISPCATQPGSGLAARGEQALHAHCRANDGGILP